MRLAVVFGLVTLLLAATPGNTGTCREVSEAPCNVNVLEQPIEDLGIIEAEYEGPQLVYYLQGESKQRLLLNKELEEFLRQNAAEAYEVSGWLSYEDNRQVLRVDVIRPVE